MISIIIPTLNEAATLPIALESIKKQDRDDIEIIIVDSASKDGTRDIATNYGAKIVDYPGRPLGARKAGLSCSKGDLVLLMDADQVLQLGTLDRAVHAIVSHDMLILEERSYDPQNWLHRSLDNQKRCLHERARRSDNVGMHLYPRFFRRDVIVRAYDMIPDDLLPKVFIYDDALLFSKLRSISKSIGLLSNAMFHIEESNALEFIIHQGKMGRSARKIRPYLNKDDFFLTNSNWETLQDCVINRYLGMSLLKEISFRFGYYFG